MPEAAKAQAEELATLQVSELGELAFDRQNLLPTIAMAKIFPVMVMGGGGAASVPISSGEMPINAEVNLTYAIK